MGSWIGNWPSGRLLVKGSSFKSMFSFGNYLLLKESFFFIYFFAGLGKVGKITGHYPSESDSKTWSYCSVSDSRSDSSAKSDSSLSEYRSFLSKTSGFGIDHAGTKNFFLE